VDWFPELWVHFETAFDWKRSVLALSEPHDNHNSIISDISGSGLFCGLPVASVGFVLLGLDPQLRFGHGIPRMLFSRSDRSSIDSQNNRTTLLFKL
jgi:hypothetical protein